MTTAKTKEVVQKADDIKVTTAPKKTNKVKTPKVKLVSYEVKAIIPVGMYANIQPGIVVQAETLEQAERAVMPHIEALFAKYREGGAMTVTTVPVKKQDETGPAQPLPKDMSNQEIVVMLNDKKVTPEQVMATAPVIPLSEPFNRAKRAIESAMSIDAVNLIEEQVRVSVKLIEDEKQTLYTQILLKRKELNG